MNLENESTTTSVARTGSSSLRRLASSWTTALAQLFGVNSACEETPLLPNLVDDTWQLEVLRPSDAASSLSHPALSLLSALYGSRWPQGVLPVPVQVRHVQCYSPVVAPLLVVLDLDHTILQCCLSDCTPPSSQTDAHPQELFVDANLLHAFCTQLSRKGHHLAIASFTEGHQMSTDHTGTTASLSSPAQTVVRLLDSALPLTRTYLTERRQIVCMPASGTSRKVPHLRLLQERLSAAEDPSASASAGLAGPLRSSSSGLRENVQTCGLYSPDSDHPHCITVSQGGDRVVSPVTRAEADTPPEHGGHKAQGVFFNTPPKQHRTHSAAWVSTEVVLIDDNVENCWCAADHGYHAFCCSEGGLTFQWLVHNAPLLQLLGLTMGEVWAMRNVTIAPAHASKVQMET